MDQTLNAVLEKCVERVYSTEEGVTETPHGLYIMRGEMVAVIGSSEVMRGVRPGDRQPAGSGGGARESDTSDDHLGRKGRVE